MLSIPSTHSSPKDVLRLKKAFFIALSFTIILWFVEIVKHFSGLEFYKFGLHPQNFFGLVGIITAPLIHASFEHLISNTPALLILGTALLYGYPRSYWIVLASVWILAELGVWFTARPVYHFGASGLTYGFMPFIFIVGILRRDQLAITLSLLVFFLYGTMIWGIFPHQSGISFETHLWGGGLGAICAVLLRKYDPIPPTKRYSWENQDEEDPNIGDAWNNIDNDLEHNQETEK